MIKRIVFSFFVLFSLEAFAFQGTLIDLETERLQIENQKTKTYSQINSIQSNIQSLSQGLAARKKKLAQRLQSTQLIKNYKWGALVELKNLTQLQRNLQTLKNINQYDLNFIREQAYKIDELKAEKEKLIKTKNAFENLAKKLQRQEDLITQQESAENEYLSKNLTPSLLLLKGQLARPITTEINEPYGLYKSDDESKMQYILYNKGIFFKPEPAATIQAVGPGKVIFRDVLNHWGESIILEHDGGYYSVYANVKNCLVQTEQKVQMSEKLCESSLKDFYFELRHYKVTINPKNWIKDLL